jgi:hypothetical protein
LEVGRLCTFLRQHRRIALDTSIFIYQLEEDIRYLALTDHIFSWLEQPGSSAVTSTITMTELLVQPYSALDEQRVDEFYGLLSTYPNLEWIAPDLQVADHPTDSRSSSFENSRRAAGRDRGSSTGNWFNHK